MAVQDWSVTASQNTTVDGINIDELCPPGNLNNGLRAIMASVRVMYDNLPSVSGLAPLSAPAFTAQPTYSGRGAVLHHNSAANASGRVYVQAEGAALPTLANGDFLYTY